MVVVASFTALFLDHGYYHGESAMRSFILPDVGEPTALAQEKSGIELHSGLSSKTRQISDFGVRPVDWVQLVRTRRICPWAPPRNSLLNNHEVSGSR